MIMNTNNYKVTLYESLPYNKGQAQRLNLVE